jgi:hypothetical protein
MEVCGDSANHTETQKNALLHLHPKVEIEHSITRVTNCY